MQRYDSPVSCCACALYHRPEIIKQSTGIREITAQARYSTIFFFGRPTSLVCQRGLRRYTVGTSTYAAAFPACSLRACAWLLVAQVGLAAFELWNLEASGKEGRVGAFVSVQCSVLCRVYTDRCPASMRPIHSSLAVHIQVLTQS